MTKAVSIAQSAASGVTVGFRNRLINGAMQIWQRGTTFSSDYTADRWQIAGTSMTAARSTDVPSTAFQYSMSFTGSSSAHIKQKIESYNCYDLVGQSITISFWAKQTVGAGSNGIGVDLYTPNSVDNYAAVTKIAGTTLTTTNAWAFYSVTFTNLASSVTNGLQPLIYFPSASSQTVIFTGVQLEVGTSATNFDYRPYTTELQLCQRYCVRWKDGRIAVGGWNSTTSADVMMKTPVTMRATPSVTALANGQLLNMAVAWYNITSVTINPESIPDIVGVTAIVSTSGAAQGKVAILGGGGGSQPDYLFTAEL
jgi:hypothetical protein